MLTATELHMAERVPLHRVHEAIFAFCAGRADVTVFGAQAVNLYTSVPRMSQDVDLLSPNPRLVAEALSAALHDELHIATRVREIRPEDSYRIFQIRKEGSRHLADVRASVPLDEITEKDGIRYVSLIDLVALKVLAYSTRRLAPKGATDLADLRRLLLSYPELRSPGSGVEQAIRRLGGTPATLDTWEELLAAPLVSDEEADEEY